MGSVQWRRGPHTAPSLVLWIEGYNLFLNGTDTYYGNPLGISGSYHDNIQLALIKTLEELIQFKNWLRGQTGKTK